MAIKQSSNLPLTLAFNSYNTAQKRESGFIDKHGEEIGVGEGCESDKPPAEASDTTDPLPGTESRCHSSDYHTLPECNVCE